MKKLTAIAIFILINAICTGQIIHIPADYTAIQSGIEAANTGDTVLVEQGVYYENINFMGKAITVSSHYLIENDSSHIYNTIINGSQPANPDSASVVLFLSGEDSTSVIYGFTITGGTGTKFPDQVNFEEILAGGGIGIDNSGAKICHNIITNNSVENEEEAFGAGIGGGLCTEEKWVVVEHNLVTNNSAISNLWPKGGGMAIAYCNTRICNNTVTHNTVSANSSIRVAAAGGIWYSCDVGFPDSVIISGNIIQHNLVEQFSANSDGTAGSGLCMYGAYGQTTRALVKNNIISDNELHAVSIVFGCGVALVNCHSVDFRQNEIYNNTYEANNCYGGGLCIWNNHPIVSRNLIYGNKAARGGGIYVGHQITSEPQFFNNTIYGNEATESGGGLYLRNAASSVTNEIMWNNTAPDSPGIFIYSGSTVAVNYSLVEDWSGPGTGNLDEDPLFVDPDNNNFHLTAESPCIDAGDPSSPPDPDGTTCDMGTYYFDQREIVALLATDTTAMSFTANWQAADDATGYLLDVATDENFTNFVFQNQDVGNVLFFAVNNLNPISVYYYRVRANYFFGRSGYSNTVVVATLTTVEEFKVQSSAFNIQCYPNPFQSQTTISFTCPDADFVNLEVCGATGRNIQTLHSGFLQEGEHSFVWNAEGLKEGMYLLRLEMDGVCEGRKLLLVKQ